MKHHPPKDPFDSNRFHLIWGIVAVVLIIVIAFFIYSPSRHTVTESMQRPTPPDASTIQTSTPSTQ